MSLENHAEVPRDFGKNLCACISCHLVKTLDQFADGGCENCGFLGMDGDKDRCLECTTVAFQGMISVIDPTSSWCSKWLHLSKMVPGCYALSVQVEVPPDIKEIMAENGRRVHESG
ncbi:hypothetical protein WJX75_004942 [Coccomyxa subellipsoidea]|uniref:Transcription elongation factor SPT4 homolog n=1 Tax=Coccomyxa subellipsoidea TaxID=248742 RepID=A0ABR2YDZ6_9CHLO